MLVKLQFIRNTGSIDLGNTILEAGFDQDGSFVSGL
jgi:hypothetical protein